MTSDPSALDWDTIDDGWEEPVGQDKKRRTRARGKKRRVTESVPQKQKKQRQRRPNSASPNADNVRTTHITPKKAAAKKAKPPWLLPAIGFVVAIVAGALVLIAAGS
jgi:hypothetical protein